MDLAVVSVWTGNEAFKISHANCRIYLGNSHHVVTGTQVLYCLAKR